MGAYVDLGYGARFGQPYVSNFSSLGNYKSGLAAANLAQARVYDTWSTHYENTVIDPNNPLASVTANNFPGKGSNGFDDPGDGLDNDNNDIVDDNDDTGNGIVDDVYEMHVHHRISLLCEHSNQDPHLRAGQRQIREVTVVQDFLPR